MEAEKIIFLVRHGTTDYNENDLLQGRMDNPLNERGIKEAELLSEQLKNEEFDACYHSPMTRAKQTAEILNKSQQEYERINIEGERLLKDLNQYFKEEKLPILAIGHKSMIMLHVLSKWIENPSMKEIIEYRDKKREALLHLAIFNRHVSGLHGLGSLSMAHNHDHIMEIKNVVEQIGHPVSQSHFD